MTVDSNQFSYDVDIPFLVKAEFINSAPFAIKLSVKHDSGSYIVKDFYVTKQQSLYDRPACSEWSLYRGAWEGWCRRDAVAGVILIQLSVLTH